MTGPPTDARAARLGLVVNPIAGLGGRVGLKGTDGEGVAERALELGARPQSSARAALALERLASAWPAGHRRPDLICGPGSMGAAAAQAAGWACVVAGTAAAVTTAQDTRQVAGALAEEGVDVLLFSGGDGTARDVSASVGERVTVLGIPAGVKVQSAVFATSPGAAGELLAQHLLGRARRTSAREVLDLDEEAYRRGDVRPRLHGVMRVPAGRLLQSRKAPTPAGDAAAMGAIAAEMASRLVPGHHYILGPGTTTRAVARHLGIDKTLAGVDVFLAQDVSLAQGARARIVAADVAEAELLALVAAGPASVVVTPIGGQGFLFGRGNQPISPTVIRAVGPEAIILLATPHKLAELGGRPFLVDTGDEAMDHDLAGHVRVITGYREEAVVPVEKA